MTDIGFPFSFFGEPVEKFSTTLNGLLTFSNPQKKNLCTRREGFASFATGFPSYGGDDNLQRPCCTGHPVEEKMRVKCARANPDRWTSEEELDELVAKGDFNEAE